MLLLPYTASPHSFRAILDVYRALHNGGRLRVAAQAAREYAKNRQKKIGEVFKYLSDRASQEPPARATYPLLEEVPAYNTLQDTEKSISAAFNRRRAALQSLQNTVRGWAWTDPVRDAYGAIFDASVTVELTIPAAEVAKIREDRYKREIPPGYKDASKTDGGIGDLAIWLTMIQEASRLQRDVIFVSGEEKSDWFARSASLPLFPRYELLDEFRQETHRAFEIVQLSGLLSAFQAPPAAVEEVRRTEEAASARRATDMWTALHAVSAHLRRRFPEAFIHFGSERDSGADVFVEADTGRIGAQVRYVHGYDRSTSDRYDRTAIREASGFRNLILFIVAESDEVASAYANKYAEERYIGPGVSVVVGVLVGETLRIVWPEGETS